VSVRRGQSGQGLIELLAAMTLLSVAVAGLLAAFSASVISLRHSGHEGTALTLADRQMEAYRSLPNSCIPTALPGSAPSGCATFAGFPDPYAHSQTVAAADSPDHQAYTVSTSLASSGATTTLTVSVSLASGDSELARESSTFSANGTPTS
jgi:type II secretory pathway pseudopilin PulG